MRKRIGVSQWARLSTVGTAWLVSLILLTVACGSTPGSSLNDTWTWNGTDWHKTTSSQSPSWRFGALFVYDEATGEIVLFGGEDGSNKLLSDTWTWNGHWTLRHPTASPPARRWPAASYDPVTSDVVMFGGSSGGGGQIRDLGDAWIWDGETWSQVTGTGRQSPPAQSFGPAAAAFDPLSKQVVLVNDPTCIVEPGEGCTPDTWSWDGKTWTVHSSSTSRLPATPTGFLYTDSTRGRLIMLGGGFRRLDGRLWMWDGANWSSVSSLPFTPVSVAGFAYDSQAAILVSFGGDRCNTAYTSSPNPTANTSDTMGFDGAAWSELQPVNRPPARDDTYLAYDSMRHEIVMFGGWVQAECSGVGALP